MENNCWQNGNLEARPDCRVSNDLGKNVPEYSRRLLCSWQAVSSWPSPPTPHQSASPDVLRTTDKRLLLFPGCEHMSPGA